MTKRELVLLEEQTILSRERTMQQYIATGLGFIGLGVVVIKFFLGGYYYLLGFALLAMGFAQIITAYVRFARYRRIARHLRKKEKGLNLEVGE